MDIGVLRVVYEGDDSRHVAANERVNKAFQNTSTNAERTAKAVEDAYDRHGQAANKAVSTTQSAADRFRAQFDYLPTIRREAEDAFKGVASATESGLGRAQSSAAKFQEQFGYLPTIKRQAQETFQAVASEVQKTTGRGVGAFGAFKDAAQAALAASRPSGQSFEAWEREQKLIADAAADMKRLGAESARTKALLEEAARTINKTQATTAQHHNEVALQELKSRTHETGAAGARSSLLLGLPGGRFAAVANDIQELAEASSAGTGAISALGGSTAIAAAGVGALGAGAALTAKLVWELVQGAAEAGKEVGDLSRRTGVSVETLSAFRLAARQSKISLEDFAGGISNFNQLVGQAARGSDEATAKLKRFGLEPRDAILGQEAALGKVFQRIMALPPGIQRSIAAQDAFGKSGDKLLGIIQKTGGNLQEFMRKAREAGHVMSTEDVAAAEAFSTSLETLKHTASEAGRQVGQGALPAITSALKDLNAATEDGSTFWKRLGDNIGWSVTMLRAWIATGNVAQTLNLSMMMANAEDPKRFHFGKDGIVLNDAQKAKSAADWEQLKLRIGRIKDETSGTGKGESESAARRAARLALERAQIDMREAESIYSDANATARRALDLNLQDYEAYNRRREELENERFEAVKAVFDKERGAIIGLKLDERLVKEADINQREQDALRDHNERMAQIFTDGLTHRADVARRFAEASAQLAEERQRVADGDLARLIAEGTKTQEDAVRARIEAMAHVATRQGEVLRLSLVQALGGDEAAAGLSDTIADVIVNAVNAEDMEGLEEGFKEILGKAFNREAVEEAVQSIRVFFLQRRQAWQQGNRDTRDAQSEDIRNWQAYAARLASIQNGLMNVGFEIQQSRVDAMSANPLQRNAEIEARRALDTAREMARSAREIIDLSAQRDQIAVTEQNERRRAELIRLTDAQIEAEHRLHSQRLADIDREAMEARREQMLEIAHDLSGIFNDVLGSIGDGWEGMWDKALESGLQTIQAISREVANAGFEALITGKPEGSSAGGIVGKASNAIIEKIFGKSSQASSTPVDFNTIATDANTRATDALTAAMLARTNSPLGSLSDAVDTEGVEGAIGDAQAEIADALDNQGRLLEGVFKEGSNRIGDTIRQLEQTMIALAPRSPGLLGAILGGAISGLTSGLLSGLGGGGSGNNEGPPQPRPTTPPVLKFKGGREYGGPVEPFGLYSVNENPSARPEWLWMGPNGGHVFTDEQMRKGMGGKVVNLTVNYYATSQQHLGAKATQEQAAQYFKNQLLRASKYD